MTATRLVLVTALVLALVAGASALTQAASAQTTSQDAGIPVIALIYAPGQSTVEDQTTIGLLESQCASVPIPIDPAQNGPGGVPEPETDPDASQEWTLSSVLTTPGCLPTPIPISAISQVTVLESNGQPDLNSAAQLSQSDLTPPGDFPDQTVPVFWDAGSQVIYERPSRNATDDNAADMVIVGPGQSLQFDVFEGESPVSVAISATATSVTAGKAVTLTAAAPGRPAGESYTWDFDGAAADSDGSQTTVSFPLTGIYDVTVQAAGPEVGLGSIEISVGSVPSGTGTETTATGPAKSSGKTPGAGAGKHAAGSAKPKNKAKPKAKAKTRAKPKTKPRVVMNPSATPTASAGDSNGSGGSATHATTRASSGATSGNPARSATANRAPGNDTSRTGTARTKPPASRLPPASGPAVTRRHSPGVRVKGRLLGTVLPLSDSSALTKSLPAGAAPAPSRPGGGEPWAAIVAAAAILALLGLGARRELRYIRSAP